MTTTAIARIVDDARINCSGALDGVIRLTVFQVLKDFLARTNAWLLELPVYIVPTTNDYVVDTCQNAIVNRLMVLNRPDSQILTPPVYAPGCPPQYLGVNTIGGMESFDPMFMTPRDGVLLSAGARQPTLRILWNPQSAEIWIATLALNITDPTDPDGLPDGVPDWLIEKYNNILSDGVISRLMLQAGKPYSSPQGAEFHGRKFNQGVGTAHNDVRKMFTFGSERWRYPQGWKTRAARRNY